MATVTSADHPIDLTQDDGPGDIGHTFKETFWDESGQHARVVFTDERGIQTEEVIDWVDAKELFEADCLTCPSNRQHLFSNRLLFNCLS